MRIGVDIDDTLTDIKEQLTNDAFEYAKTLNKKVENENIDILIDDSISNCKNVITAGISAIMITNSDVVEKNNISCFKSWIDIYNYLHKFKGD